MKRSVALIAVTLSMSVYAAEEAAKKPWSDAAGLGVVVTSGNSEGTNFAFSDKFKYTGLTNSLALKMSYTIAYSNRPPVKLVPANPGPGPDAIYEFEKTDTILTAALVIDF